MIIKRRTLGLLILSTISFSNFANCPDPALCPVATCPPVSLLNEQGVSSREFIQGVQFIGNMRVSFFGGASDDIVISWRLAEISPGGFLLCQYTNSDNSATILRTVVNGWKAVTEGWSRGSFNICASGRDLCGAMRNVNV